MFVGGISALNSTFGSSLPSNAIPYIADEFGVTSQSQLVLPISIYLVGYVCGPVLYGPLSESFGRRIIFAPTFTCYVIFTMACALSPNWAALNIFRCLCGIVASAPIAVVGGLYSDVYSDPITRGRAMSIFMAATGLGPLFSPVLSGFISPALGWRWTFWVGLMIAGLSWVPIVLMPETYGPIILAKRARKMRKEGKGNIWAPIELEKKGFKQMATVVLTRPIRMLCFELIVASASAYCALVYAIFYMYFEAYPIVFQGIYGMSSGVSGLMFLPIGIGQFTGMIIFLWYDGYLARARAAGKSWTKQEESRRLPLALIGGPCLVIGIFWLGWTSRSSVPWVVPFLAGIPFGTGFVLIFMALLNYLTDAYAVFAASAMAASSCTRSIFGATLPFAARPMYERLGVPWASSLLGFLSLAMCAVPVLFLKYGDVIRRNSKFCTYLRELKEKEEAGVGQTKTEVKA